MTDEQDALSEAASYCAHLDGFPDAAAKLPQLLVLTTRRARLPRDRKPDG